MTEPNTGVEGARAQEIVLSVDPARVIRIWVGTWVAIEVLFLLAQVWVSRPGSTVSAPIRHLLGFKGEESFLDLAGVTQTLGLTLAMWLAFVLEQRRLGTGWRPRGWLVLALAFTVMTLDAGGGLRWALESALREMAVDETAIVLSGHVESGLSGASTHAGQWIWMPLVLVLGIFQVVYLWRVFSGRVFRGLLVAASTLYVAGLILDTTGGVGFQAFNKFVARLATTVLTVLILRHIMNRAAEIRLVRTP